MNKKARIIIGANYGDEGKGTVVASYTKNQQVYGNVLNILTNGGAQRGHTVGTQNESICYQHFGSGTHYEADSYYSRFFILNPMQFVKEYTSLLVKPKNIYRDSRCMWTTPYDTMANLIESEAKGKHNTCGMGIWNTIKRYRKIKTESFDTFFDDPDKELYLRVIKAYYERQLDIPHRWKPIWNNYNIVASFIRDCAYMYLLTRVVDLQDLNYNNLIFENGQGLLLSDTGRDTDDTTPSQTGIHDALELLKDIPNVDITAHYVTRPYLTRHGDGMMIDGEVNRNILSSCIEEDTNNHYNHNQGLFRYGNLDIQKLKNRVVQDAKGVPFELDITHCDEMDRIAEFSKHFCKINTYDNRIV